MVNATRFLAVEGEKSEKSEQKKTFASLVSRQQR